MLCLNLLDEYANPGKNGPNPGKNGGANPGKNGPNPGKNGKNGGKNGKNGGKNGGVVTLLEALETAELPFVFVA